jgi:hypothetical protein
MHLLTCSCRLSLMRQLTHLSYISALLLYVMKCTVSFHLLFSEHFIVNCVLLIFFSGKFSLLDESYPARVAATKSASET